MDAIEKLTEQVQRVAVEATALDAAREAEDEAAIELLTRVIEIAQPIVHAIGTRPITRSVTSWINSVQTKEKIWRRDHRCICISDDKPGPTRDAGDTSGPYEGVDLFLDEECLVELSYSGSWSRWQGSSSGWSATVTEYFDAAAAYADGWHDVERYVERLSEIVTKANLAPATKKSRERAEKLAAIAALVRK